jgi:hypothetical protein
MEAVPNTEVSEQPQLKPQYPTNIIRYAGFYKQFNDKTRYLASVHNAPTLWTDTI